MYRLKIEDLTRIGGQMGTEYTTSSYRYFTSIIRAKWAAQKHYDKHTKKHTYKENPNGLVWTPYKNGYTRTDDLLFVMYHIEKIKPEE